MGTETKFTTLCILSFIIQPVKLNNPLMGTETMPNVYTHHLASWKVKLNNPLMGTETF